MRSDYTIIKNLILRAVKKVNDGRRSDRRVVIALLDVGSSIVASFETVAALFPGRTTFESDFPIDHDFSERK